MEGEREKEREKERERVHNGHSLVYIAALITLISHIISSYDE